MNDHLRNNLVPRKTVFTKKTHFAIAQSHIVVINTEIITNTMFVVLKITLKLPIRNPLKTARTFRTLFYRHWREQLSSAFKNERINARRSVFSTFSPFSITNKTPWT